MFAFPARFLRLSILACGLAGCLLAPAQAQATDLSGRWEGYWESCSSGHRGVLRADFCRLNSQCYEVTFSGRFFKIMPFRYKVNLRVVGQNPDGSVRLAGSSYLGRLVGTFHYQACANGCQFTSQYRSCKDHGRFVLKRTCR